jgi:predicted CXXCH cytochrome family protein
MAIHKVFFFAGMAFLLSVFATANFLFAGANDTNSPIQQSFMIDASLIARQEKMQDSCFAAGCHEKFNVRDAASTHKPFAQGHCESCHAPAAHLQQKKSTADSQIALCHECHSTKSLGNSHKIGKDAIDPNTGKAITCGTCHSPHYAQKENLLELDGRGELCLSCHKEFLSKP